ncbi:hypothetical protein HAX54_011816, partial [Datura stramonium]|nr:hypothetical protein [Datura stramonium]
TQFNPFSPNSHLPLSHRFFLKPILFLPLLVPLISSASRGEINCLLVLVRWKITAKLKSYLSPLRYLKFYYWKLDKEHFSKLVSSIFHKTMS